MIIRDIIESHKQGYYKPGKPTDGDVHFVRISDINDDAHVSVNTTPMIHVDEDEINRFSVKQNDFLFARTGGAGRFALVQNDLRGIFASYLIRFRFNKNYNPFFLRYFFLACSFQNELKSKIHGGVNQNVHAENIKDCSVPNMPLAEQEGIVEVLDKAFAAIDQAKANIEQNIANAKELFQSKLNQIFSQKGEGWVEGKLGEYCDLSRGHNPPKSKFISEPKEGYVRFWQIRDGWSEAHKVYVPESPQLHTVEPEDFLMVAYRHIGKVFRGAKGAFNVALCKIKNVRQDLLLDDYLFHMIPSNVIRGELLKRSERSLIPSMSIKHLEIIEIPVPPLDEQRLLIQQLDSLTSETKEIESIYQTKLASLDELKKSILQKAFAGELT